MSLPAHGHGKKDLKKIGSDILRIEGNSLGHKNSPWIMVHDLQIKQKLYRIIW